MYIQNAENNTVLYLEFGPMYIYIKAFFFYNHTVKSIKATQLVLL